MTTDEHELTADSIVCWDYPNCPLEHAGGMGGTPVHPPEGSVIVPGHFDHGVPSDVPDLSDAERAALLAELGMS